MFKKIFNRNTLAAAALVATAQAATSNDWTVNRNDVWNYLDNVPNNSEAALPTDLSISEKRQFMFHMGAWGSCTKNDEVVEKCLHILRNAMQDNDPAIRVKAVSTMWSIARDTDFENDLDTLAQYMNDPDVLVQAEAVKGIWVAGQDGNHQQAVDLLETKLNSAETDIRKQLALGLGYLGRTADVAMQSRVINLLERMLDDEIAKDQSAFIDGADIKHWVIDGLGEVGQVSPSSARQVMDILSELANKNPENTSVLWEIGDIGKKQETVSNEAFDILFSTLNSSDENIRRAISNHLGDLADNKDQKRMEQLIEAFESLMIDSVEEVRDDTSLVMARDIIRSGQPYAGQAFDILEKSANGDRNLMPPFVPSSIDGLVQGYPQYTARGLSLLSTMHTDQTISPSARRFAIDGLVDIAIKNPDQIATITGLIVQAAHDRNHEVFLDVISGLYEVAMNHPDQADTITQIMKAAKGGVWAKEHGGGYTYLDSFEKRIDRINSISEEYKRQLQQNNLTPLPQ